MNTSGLHVSLFSTNGKNIGSIKMPNIFSSPLRRDLVQFVHTNMRKNNRQPYGVKCHFGPTGIVAGHQHSAHSWGTGRAVSRIPRVSGGGTHRAGQGAFGNMCRGGRMFAPTKTFRRWHRKINVAQKRQAISSCLAASASVPLIQARGHRITEKIEEIPIVVEGLENLKQTKEAISCFYKLGLKEELLKCKQKHVRAGKGKMRGRRYRRRCGPLIIYKEKNLLQAFQNIPGVEVCRVDALNLLQLAPGGHVGRLIVWSKAAFTSLENWLSGKKEPKIIMTNSDLHGLINSDEIQAVIRGPKKNLKTVRKRNLLNNRKSRFETFKGLSLEELVNRKRNT